MIFKVAGDAPVIALTNKEKTRLDFAIGDRIGALMGMDP
jgi:hypothetical protein